VKALSGHTLPFAVLGHPIGHTLSPVMHNAAFEALGMDAIYLALDVAPERLLEVLPAMQTMGFKGVNLTVPLKEVAYKGFSNLDESARRLGAVNTVEFRPDGPRGHNTDGKGFLTAIRESFGTEITGLTVFILGCGGAGRAVAITAAVEGADRILLADIDARRCHNLAKDIASFAPAARVESVGTEAAAWSHRLGEVDLVVQASPVGMKPDDVCPVPAQAFRKGQMAFDLVYNLPQTCFTRTASAGGAKAVNGLGMLLHQGAEAFTIWTGQPAAVGVMRQALEGALYKK
jgi:shikimate dehydrogenase